MSLPPTQNTGIESVPVFEKRKQDHIQLSLDEKNQASGGNGLGNGLDQIQLIHEALPDLDFTEVSLKSNLFNQELKTPFLISSMTAGHFDSLNINERLARVSSERGWLMGVGSQRRELYDKDAQQEWKNIRKAAPHAKLLGNIGLSQIINTTLAQIESLVESLEAFAMIIHLNPLQECLQPEGTPNFKGGLQKLAELSQKLSVPVVVKETGCGFSSSTLMKLGEAGVSAVDISGYGGTHWGRIEGNRSPEGSLGQKASESFQNWGLNTFESLMNAVEVQASYSVWASGGIRSGVDAAKCMALGADIVGFAKPILQAALVSEESLHQTMEQFEFELKTAMFCTGCQKPQKFRERQVWQWQKI